MEITSDIDVLHQSSIIGTLAGFLGYAHGQLSWADGPFKELAECGYQ